MSSIAATRFPAYASYQFFGVTSPAPFVAHIEIQRPAKLNSFSRPVWREFGAVFRQVAADRDVRAVVFSGAGEKAFTAGLDVKEAVGELMMEGEKMDAARKGQEIRRVIQEFQDCISEMERCEKPVICVLHGISLGLAIDIACCADIRLCTSDARLAVKEVDIGMAADIGSLARLPKIVGSAAWVREVCLTGREFGAVEAIRVGFARGPGPGPATARKGGGEQKGDIRNIGGGGFATKEEALAEAVMVARCIAEKSPVAAQGTKRALLHAMNHSVGESLQFIKVWNALALQSADFRDSLLAAMQQEKPIYAKL